MVGVAFSMCGLYVILVLFVWSSFQASELCLAPRNVLSNIMRDCGFTCLLVWLGLFHMDFALEVASVT